MDIPSIKLNHLKTLTDCTGVMQHAKYATPRRNEGYTTDDNARALIACVKHHQLFGDKKTEELIDTYLSFLLHMQRPDGQFHNFLSYERRFLDDVGSEDCSGRSLWACGYTLDSNLSEEKKLISREIFDNGFRCIHNFKSPRAQAFAAIGLKHYIAAFPEDQNRIQDIRIMVNPLVKNYSLHISPKWRWFEPYLTYDNARLAQALFEAYSLTKDSIYLQIGAESFDFLMGQQMIAGQFFPISNKGVAKGRTDQALYDQQPLEASCMVEAASSAFQIKGEEKYRRIANVVFNWFLGENSRNVAVYNSETGGCYDGITPGGLNLNQGAESTISYLLARLELEKFFK